MKNLGNRIHLEKCKNIKASILYCAKDEDYVSKGLRPDELVEPKEYNGEDIIKKELFRPWQSKALELMMKPAEDRTVYWIWENKGNTGKTSFSKYMLWWHQAMIVQKGKYSDIMNMAFNHENLSILIIDIPRSNGNGYTDIQGRSHTRSAWGASAR